MMRQLQLLPAGCQPWNANMLDGTQSKFAYCSTLAVYIYEILPGSHEYKLTSINAEHTKTITSISWNRKKPNLIATSGIDLKILVWDVSKQKVVAQLKGLKSVPCCIDWVNNSEHPSITFIGSSGYMEEWNISTGKVTSLKNIACGTSSKVSIFRWHHTRFESIAFGHCDGTVSIFAREKGGFKKKSVKFYEDAIDEDTVILLSWDPLSDDYLLVANKITGVRMVDTVSASVITQFCLPSRAVTTSTFSWVSSAPGMFLTGDRDTGILRLWTVGQDSPLENFKIKAMGFSGIHVLDSLRGKQVFDENFTYGYRRRKPSQSLPVTHSVPPANVVCTFRDGGVGLFDLQRRRWIFLKDQGHIETIFDCKFKADDPKLLATASFDGTVKIWSTSDLCPIKTSSGNEGVIYSISWAPQNLNCIACGTRRKGVFVWDFNKGKVIKRFNGHGSYSVFCVAWNKKDSHKIASASEDGTCIVTGLDGRESKKLSHPAAVYGCDWNNEDKSLLATGCDDTVVRVWSVGTDIECIAFKGHNEKVFHVRWHPLIPNILCSGSDDGSIMIWDTNAPSKCIGVLRGHTSKVRGLSWNCEIPYLLVSGSWDSTIRLWDARQSEQKCLDVISDHGADVYGLDTHPSSPFMVASSSRDSTVRLWTLAPKVSTLFAKVLAGHHFDSILCTPEEGMASNSGLRLAGKMSKQITDELRQRPNSTVGKLRWFSELFCANPALENLWDLAFFDLGVKESALSTEYKHGILHMDHLVKYNAAEAQELELSASAKSHTGNRQQEGILERAAALHLKVGNLRKHCEILKLLGKWETALSLAAGVSLKYWKNLAEEYAEILEKSDDREYLQYRIAIGNSEKCIQDLMQAGEYADALIISQSAYEGRIAPPILKSSKKIENGEVSEDTNGNSNGNSRVEILRNHCFDSLSHSKISGGDPFRAASYLLSKNDPTAAINVLVQGNELLLAICLGEALKKTGSVIREATLLFSRKLIGQSNYIFAIEILQAFLHCDTGVDKWTPVHATCARFVGEMSYRESLHEYANIPSPSEFYKDGERYLESGELVHSMRCFLLSTHRNKALEIGLNLLHRHLSSGDWSLCNPSLDDLVAVFNISSDVLTSNGKQCQRNQLLAISAFFGGLKAINNGFLSVVMPLFEHAIAMTERVEMSDVKNFPLTSQELKKYLHAWKDHMACLNCSDEENADPTNVGTVIQKLFTWAGVKSIASSNETVVAGSNLPSHSDIVVSALTNRKITGPKFCLDDGTTIISINEAIMWARVNEFSPTGSGKRIIPF